MAPWLGGCMYQPRRLRHSSGPHSLLWPATLWRSSPWGPCCRDPGGWIPGSGSGVHTQRRLIDAWALGARCRGALFFVAGNGKMETGSWEQQSPGAREMVFIPPCFVWKKVAYLDLCGGTTCLLSDPPLPVPPSLGACPVLDSTGYLAGTFDRSISC